MQSSPFPETSEVRCPCGYLPQGGRVCAASLINHIGIHLSLGDLMVISNNNLQDPFISAPWLVQFKQTVLLHREGLLKVGSCSAGLLAARQLPIWLPECSINFLRQHASDV